MPDFDAPAEALALLELVARAVRDELRGEVDAYPGFREPERADPMNRAFRAVASAVLGMYMPASPSTVSACLRRLAERRLEADGFDTLQIKLLLDEEPGGPDDWLTFLTLSSRSQVADVLRADDPDRA
jgi:hypothetical protein